VQNNGHYAVQGHSRSPIFVAIEKAYATSYLHSILHRFEVIVNYWSIFFAFGRDTSV